MAKVDEVKLYNMIRIVEKTYGFRSPEAAIMAACDCYIRHNDMGEAMQRLKERSVARRAKREAGLSRNKAVQ